jgi:dienelactone hydrolase
MAAVFYGAAMFRWFHHPLYPYQNVGGLDMANPEIDPSQFVDRQERPSNVFTRAGRSTRAMVRSAIFFLKVFPMLPSRPVDWVTHTPVIEKVRYPSLAGPAEGDLYRPPTDGPHPGIVVCLGVVPFGVEHPQVAVLGRALARSGFAALLYWSPSMREFQLDPADIENIALAYNWLIEQPYVDAARSGLLGTCVGGSFALMAAARPLIRNQVSFLSAYAPFSSMWTFARDIASATRSLGDQREPWQVDQLTRKVFVYSLTALLEPDEAKRLRAAYEISPDLFDSRALSADGQAVQALLVQQDVKAAERALHRLPPSMQARLTVMSPLNYLKDIHAPLFVQLHDIGDQLIPISESRQLQAALTGRSGVRYTEMQFSHLDPTKGKLPLSRLLREFWKFLLTMYPLFLHSTRS